MSMNHFKAKYVQISRLCQIFDLSDDYFDKRRENGTFKLNVHYVIPPDSRNNRTKKVILWDVNNIENWFKESQKDITENHIIDDEVVLLLNRKNK